MIIAEYDISLDRLTWAARCAGDVTGGARPYLDAVLIEPRDEGGAWIVGTNGTVMAIAKDPAAVCLARIAVTLCKTITGYGEPKIEYDDDDEPVTIWPLTEGARLRFDAPTDDTPAVAGVYLSADKDRPHDYGLVSLPFAADKFPPWRKAIAAQNTKTGPVGMFDPALMSRLSYRGGGVLVMPRSATMPGRDGRMTAPLVVIEGAPWAMGTIMPRNLAAVEKYGETMRELVPEAELPPGLDVFTAPQGETP